MERVDIPAGSKQRIVVYVTEDDGSSINAIQVFSDIARDAAALEADGWAIVSTASMPLRQTGTAGNILFQSGGQYATQAGIAVIYARP